MTKNFQTQGYEAKVTRHDLPNYPADHKVGMRVPVGGSNCHKCHYVAGQKCQQKDFVKWLGKDTIPAPTNQYCCDFFETRAPY